MSAGSTLTASPSLPGLGRTAIIFQTKLLWRDVLVPCWLLAVLICQSNERAPMHGHQAITAGFHANRKRHGTSLFWELSSATMVRRRQNQGRTRGADTSIRLVSLLDRMDVRDDGLFIILKNKLGVLFRIVFNRKSHFSKD